MKTTRYFTLAALLFIAFMVFGTGVPLAWADSKTVVGNTMNLDPTTIKLEQHSSLVLYKGISELPGYSSGVAAGASNTIPIAGAKFTIKRIQGIELNTSEGWEKAQRLRVEEAATMQSDYIDSAETDETGKAKFPSAPVGLYLVKEVNVGDTQYGEHRVAPFMLTIPIGNITGDEWQYDVEINVKTTKFVDDNSGMPKPWLEGLFPFPFPFFPGGGNDGDSGNGSGNGAGGRGGRDGDWGGRGGDRGDRGRDGQDGGENSQTDANMARQRFGNDGRLAQTGSNVAAVIAFSIVLVLGGLMLLRRRSV